jgi:hypothetical protein
MLSDLKEIRVLANKFFWEEIDHQENICMISFHRVIDDENVRMNIYYSTMTVATCLNHPKKGKTQLFRKRVSMGLIEGLFYNPRLHTKKGYYEKRRW